MGNIRGDDLSIGIAYPLMAADTYRLRTTLNDLMGASAEIVALGPEEPLPSHCQVYFAEDGVPEGLGEHPNLAWIQACSAGADAFQTLSNVRRGATMLTTASGIHSVQIAEFVVASMINLSRHADIFWSLAKSHEWPSGRDNLAGPALRGRTVAILGYGSIGREVGRVAHLLGMKVVAITSRSEPHPDDGYHIAPGIGDPDGVLPCGWYSSSDLPKAVSNADFLVISCPFTPKTVGIVNQSVFEAMKSDACLINVARGRIVDFEALQTVLMAGGIAGAVLDVHATEPLAPDDPVYDLPNAYITPHISGVMKEEEYSRLLCNVYIENATRFLKRDKMLNQVDPI